MEAFRDGYSDGPQDWQSEIFIQYTEEYYIPPEVYISDLEQNPQKVKVRILFSNKNVGKHLTEDKIKNIFIISQAELEYIPVSGRVIPKKSPIFTLTNAKSGSIELIGIALTTYAFIKDYKDLREGIIALSKDIYSLCKGINKILMNDRMIEDRIKIINRKYPRISNINIHTRTENNTILKI